MVNLEYFSPKLQGLIIMNIEAVCTVLLGLFIQALNPLFALFNIKLAQSNLL